MTTQQVSAVLAALDALTGAVDGLNDRVTLLTTQVPNEYLSPFMRARIQIEGERVERSLRDVLGVVRAATASGLPPTTPVVSP